MGLLIVTAMVMAFIAVGILVVLGLSRVCENTNQIAFQQADPVLQRRLRRQLHAQYLRKRRELREYDQMVAHERRIKIEQYRKQYPQAFE